MMSSLCPNKSILQIPGTCPDLSHINTELSQGREKLKAASLSPLVLFQALGPSLQCLRDGKRETQRKQTEDSQQLQDAANERNMFLNRNHQYQYSCQLHFAQKGNFY